MRLTNVTIRNYRSYAVGQRQKTPDVELGAGLNLIVGPNNCGKSNLLRALALALQDPSDPMAIPFNSAVDLPRQLQWAYAVVTLRFQCGSTSVEKTLLKYLHEYEQSAGAKSTYAEKGEVHLRVTQRPKSGREDTFAVRSKPRKIGDRDLLDRAMQQFRKCVRFIYLRSGESLREFLRGTFRELLHTVLRENLETEFADADHKREAYVRDLSSHLFSQLGEHVLGRLRNVMAEIGGVTIKPFVPALPETISNGDIWIRDSADTALADKGSGVRGTLLVALLSYLAKFSKRSLVLAVEEPESFLHPQAQESLRRDLASLAKRPDVSLLVTTHSPFLLDRSPGTRITSLRKNADGRSEISDQIAGDEPHTTVVRQLFGDAVTPMALEMVQPLRTGKQAALFVEGFTDKAYLEHAADVFGKRRALDSIDIRYGDGAVRTAVDAILFRQMTADEIPIAGVFDSDEFGKKARKLLTDKFRFDGRTILQYRKWVSNVPGNLDVEAEDLFSQALLLGFVEAHGESVMQEKVRVRDGVFHYGFTQDAKGDFVRFVCEQAEAREMAMWERALNDLLDLLGVAQ
jgi:putative ATP-dependent endonuclease of the OLD family